MASIFRARVGVHTCGPHAPDSVATLLKVVGVGFIIGIGFPSDFNVALNRGAGHPIEREHFALSIGQADGNAKVPTACASVKVLLLPPGGRFVGVSSLDPAPELVRQIVVQFLKSPLGGSMSIVIGPTLQERIEFANERLLAEAQDGLNAEPDFVPQGLNATLCGEGQEFVLKFAHGVPQKVEAVLNGGDDGLFALRVPDLVL